MISGWCSPGCGKRAHATCQERQDKGWLDGCECERWGGHSSLDNAPAVTDNGLAHNGIGGIVE